MKYQKLPPEFATTPKTVFVEDLLTKEYLYTLWGEWTSIINIYVTPGSQTVRSFTNYWGAEYPDRFFGIIDGDFDIITNTNPNNPANLFKLPVHEIENYLIDIEAIKNSTFNLRTPRSYEDLDNRVADFTRDKKYWFAACYTLVKIDSGLKRGHNYPPFPSVNEIFSPDDIVSYIQDRDYILSLYTFVEQQLYTGFEGFVNSCVDDVEQVYSARRERLLMPGKQVFRHIRGFLFNPADRNSLALDIDLAKEIAEYQKRNSEIPPDISNILNHITEE